MPEAVTIIIKPAFDERGFMYDIFLEEMELLAEDATTDDGGLCTSMKLSDAIGMAMSDAIRAVNRKSKRRHVCDTFFKKGAKYMCVECYKTQE